MPCSEGQDDYGRCLQDNFRREINDLRPCHFFKTMMFGYISVCLKLGDLGSNSWNTLWYHRNPYGDGYRGTMVGIGQKYKPRGDGQKNKSGGNDYTTMTHPMSKLQWMQVDASGCKWMQVDASGCKWMRVFRKIKSYQVHSSPFESLYRRLISW